MDLKIGKITHYFPKIGVAVVSLEKKLKIKDKIKISGHDKEFIQEVTSMQIDHQPVKEAFPGDDVALKVDKPVKENGPYLPSKIIRFYEMARCS